MKKHSIVFLLLSQLVFTGMFAQSVSDNEAILSNISQMFQAMRKRDSALAKQVFMPGAGLCTVSLKNGVLKRDSMTLNGFLEVIGKPSPKVWEERFEPQEVKIMVDGPLASAWVPYRFYADTTFSHCGVDLFTLVKDGKEGWKIAGVLDTRQKEGCITYSEKQALAKKTIDQALSEWHLAAAKAAFDPYFDLMPDQGVFLGTDKTERWNKKKFMEFSKPFFDKGKAWSFKATERFIMLDAQHELAWFDETLDTWMGPCRGSGVFQKNENGQWKLAHYNLTLLVPNEKMNEVIKVIGESKGK